MAIRNRKYKDSVFTDLFGSDRDGKKNFLDLYNALSGSDYHLEDVKNEVAYLISLLKQKYGVPEDCHVQVDHRGGSHLYDEWIYTVDIDQRYSFTVSRKYTSPGPGWEISIRLTDKIPDMNEADLDAL